MVFGDVSLASPSVEERWACPLSVSSTDLPFSEAGDLYKSLQALKYNCQVDLFGDAVTGQDIIECDSAICNEQPCHNGGVCNQDPSGTAWFCDCAPGFTGALTLMIRLCPKPEYFQVLSVRDQCATQTRAFTEAPVLGRETGTASSAFARSDVEEASARRRFGS